MGPVELADFRNGRSGRVPGDRQSGRLADGRSLTVADEHSPASVVVRQGNPFDRQSGFGSSFEVHFVALPLKLGIPRASQFHRERRPLSFDDSLSFRVFDDDGRI